MRKIRYLVWLGAGSLVGLLSLTRMVQAQTVISDGYLVSNTVWSAENSPYIIEDTVIVPLGRSLTIKPGTVVVGSSTMQDYEIINVRGLLTAGGQSNSRILIEGFGSLDVSGGSLNISNTDLYLSDGISMYNSIGRISSSTISKAKRGLSITSSQVTITGSRIIGNDYGLEVKASDTGGIFPVRGNDQSFGRGGIGNAIEDNSSLAYGDNDSSQITIAGSVIAGNSEAAIKNDDLVPIQAKNNWWGNSAGPSYFGQNRIEGTVTYSPWLISDPLIQTVQPSCCSSILFIPGLEGTRLYRDELAMIGSTTNRLWEPNRNEDVRKLYLDSNGSSIDTSIYSRQPISKAFGLKDIYGRFMDYLEGLHEEGKINEWKAFGYDWRKPIDEVVAGNQKRATTTESLIEVVQELANRSKTGKVTLIAHSNGGLVAKYLVKTLADLGKENLIDSVISVAVPYLGTPQAIAGLLHGDNQSIASGLITSAATARGLGINMPSAYPLLPSYEYFSKILSPTIVFASTTVPGLNENSYPKTVDSYDIQKDFILDSGNSRQVPSFGDTWLPAKGNSALLAMAELIHGAVDHFSWPATIVRWSLVGWNESTAKNIEYYEKKFCIRSNCIKVPFFKIIKTAMGDGTVVVPSAAHDSGTVVSLDLNKLARDEKRDIIHANIFGASSTETIIDNIISSSPTDDRREIIDRISKIPGVTIGEPDYNQGSDRLRVSTHSPVELHVYDSQGNHTGLMPKPAGLDEDVEDDLYTFFENEILGSDFRMIEGYGGSNEYEIDLPDDNGEKYQVVIEGTGFGEFTFDVERIVRDVTVDKVEFVGMPVNPLMVATTTIWARSATASSGDLLASTTNVLHIDVDGDSRSDIDAKPGGEYDPIIHLEAIKKTISNLIGSNPRSKALLKRIDKIEDLIKKGKMKKAQAVSEKLNKRFDHIKLKNLTEAERKEIVDMIDLFIRQFE